MVTFICKRRHLHLILCTQLFTWCVMALSASCFLLFIFVICADLFPVFLISLKNSYAAHEMWNISSPCQCPQCYYMDVASLFTLIFLLTNRICIFDYYYVYFLFLYILSVPNSSVSVVKGIQAARLENWGSISGRKEIFLLATEFRLEHISSGYRGHFPRR
jgi:hypothetical protein